MSQAPYPSGKPSPWSAAPVDSAHGGGGLKTLLIVLLVTGCVTFVLIIAACGLAYFGVQQAVRPSIQVVLPERGEQAASDASDLAASLQRYVAAAEPPAPAHPQADELRSWFDSQVALTQQGAPISPQADLFFAAVMNSPEGKELNLLQQIQLRASLDAGVPEPATVEDYTILNIGEDSTPDTARVSVVFYSSTSLASLQTWYVIRRDGQWNLYDWFEADYGRRKSDEYGHYCRHLLADHVDGFDEAEQLVYEATEANAAGDTEDARSLLQQAEQVQMLPYDRDRGLLGIGRGYQHLGDETHAVKVFQKARQPAAVSGILASLGVSQSEIGKPKAALQSAEQLRKVYPHHPAADLVSAHAYEGLNQQTKAAEHYLRYLAACPNDTSVFSWMLLAVQPEQAAEIVRVLRHSDHSQTYLIQLLVQGEGSAEMLLAVEAAIAEIEDAPALWKTLSQIARRRGQGDIRGALKQLNEAFPATQKEDAPTESTTAESTTELREQTEQWLVQWSLESGELDELRKRKDFSDLMQQIAEELYMEDVFLDASLLEASLATLPDAQRELPGVAAVRGWAAWQEDRFADAVAHLSAWLDAHPKLPADDSPEAQETLHQESSELELAVAGASKILAGDPESGDDYLRDEIPWYLNHALASLGRYEEALRRFADNRALCWNTVEMLIQRHDQEAAEQVRAELASLSTPTAAMMGAALDAALAAWSGDAEEADRHWIACLKSFGEVDPESHSRDFYAFDSIARQRGQTAVRLGHVLPLLADSSAPGWKATAEAICDRAADLLDAQLAGLVTVALVGTEPVSPTTTEQAALANAVWKMNAELAERQGDWESAVAHRRRLLHALEQENWEFPYRRQALAKTLIRSVEAREGNELTMLLQNMDDDSFWASYYAARGMDVEVRESLSKLNSQQRGQWYASDLNRPYVLHNRELAEWLSQSESPLSIAYTPPIESVLLIEDRPRPLTAAEIGEAVAAIVGPEGSVSQVTTALPEGVESRWAIRVPNSVDAIVTIGTGTLETDSVLPLTVEETLAESRGYIAIDMIRSDQPYYHVALPLAAQLASETTHLVCAENSGYLWKKNGIPWAERLALEESLPVDSDTLRVDYIYLSFTTDSTDPQDESREGDEGEEPVTGETIDADWLRAKLAKDEGGYPVLVQISAGNAAEQIPATATAIDADTWLVDLELGGDSSVLPALQKGQRMRANSYNLVHP